MRHRHSGTRQLAGTILVVTALATAAHAQPGPPVRVCAEWEPALGTLISWPLGIPQELVVELAQDDVLFVLARTPAHEDAARATFTSWGIDLANVEFIRTDHDSHWTRDWGPHQIFDGNGQWAIIDPIFEGYPWVSVECVPVTSPGGHAGDDAVNADVAAYFGAPLHTFPAYLTGGNFLVDGHAAAFSACVMVGENNQLWTETEFLTLADQYLGVADYHIVDNTEDYGIHHIDCWMKPLDEETLLVKQVPEWHEEYDRIEANLAALADVTTCYGRPYRIIRIDCPPYDGYNIAAYTNSLILNKKVFVPLFNIPGDTQALATFQEALPGYEVIGFPWGSWYYYDALHCRARAIFDRHMLRITHRRLDAEVLPAEQHPIEAFIDDRSEAGLIEDELRVYWRVPDAPDWTWLPLTPTADPDTYAAAIPGQPSGFTVEYYLAAADYSGRAETLPRTAPAGFYRFTIADTSLSLDVPDPPLTLTPWTLTTFDLTIDPGDESLLPDTALLHYRYHGDLYLTAPLTPLGDNHYRATLPRALCQESPEFYVSAAGSDSGVKTAPPDAPAVVFSASVGEITPTTLMSQTFEFGLPPGWSTSGLWHVTDACEIAPPCDGYQWAYYGLDASCTYDNGAHNFGELTSAAIDLPTPAPGGQITLTYCSNLETEDEPAYDIAGLYANDIFVDAPDESPAWQVRDVDLTPFAGQTAVLAWSFDTIDDFYNNYHGWQVDAVTIVADTLDCDFVSPFATGDLNCGGSIDFFDIDPFVLALTDEATYNLAYPDCHPLGADCNGDGQINFFDIDAFVVLISG